MVLFKIKEFRYKCPNGLTCITSLFRVYELYEEEVYKLTA